MYNPSAISPGESDEDEVISSSSSDYDSTPEPKRHKKKSTASSIRVKPECSSEKDILYEIDCKPDTENLQYESVYSGNVAIYRRRFDCLGLRPYQQLKWTDGRSKLSKKKKRKMAEQGMRYFTGRLKHSPSDITIVSKTRSSGMERLSDFIKVENSTVAQKKEDSSSLTVERYMSKLTGEYNRSLLEQPHNVSLWLEFLAFQDQLLEWGHLPGETSENIGRKKRALSERKIAILERALEHNPTSEELLIDHMSLVQEVWPSDKLVKKWKDIIFHHPNKPVLWLHYIHFCQTNFASFGTSSLISLFTKSITTLSSILQGTLKSHHPLPNTPSYLLTIFSLFCNFLKEVGLSERAVACYQALIEFNLCVPSELGNGDLSVQSMKEFFEPFWDSGASRFGENGAVGWNSWTKNRDTAMGLIPHLTGPSMKNENEEMKAKDDNFEVDLISGLSLAKAWLTLEDCRMVTNCLPWQPDSTEEQTDVEDCSDPDRMVTFDDVSQTLFLITDPDLKLKLVWSFLSFLGAPVYTPFQSPVTFSLNLEAMCEISPVLFSPFLEGTNMTTFDLAVVPRGLGLTCFFPPASSLTDFATSFTKQVLSRTPYYKSPTRTSAMSNFISNVCNQSLSLLLTPDHQTQLALIWLSFLFSQLIENHSQPSGEIVPRQDLKNEIRMIHKLLKSFLRLDQHRNDLALWNWYAVFEYSVGNFKESRKLYQSILAQQVTPDASLCSTLCECFLGLNKSLWGDVERDPTLTLHALVCLAEGKNSPPASSAPSPARLLKARSYFNQITSSLEGDLTGAVYSVLCCAYFEYATRGLTDALKVFDESVERLKLYLEEMHDNGQGKTSILHCLKKVYSRKLKLLEESHLVTPSLSRKLLEEALELFPNDPSFMTAFIRNERQTFISGCMRRHFDRTAPRAGTPLPWLFAVVSELDRYARVTSRQDREVEESSIGTVRRIMGLLNRASTSDNARHCPLLWRIYLSLQVSLTCYNGNLVCIYYFLY